MRCNKVKRFLNRYIDKELLDKKVIALIEQHLEVCPHCKAQLNSLISMKDFIAQKERIVTGEEFLAKLKDRLTPEAPIIRIKWLPQAGDLARRLIPIPVAAAVLIFSLIFARPNGVTAVNDYIFGELSNEEIAVLSGYIDNSDLLTKMVFKDEGGD